MINRYKWKKAFLRAVGPSVIEKPVTSILSVSDRTWL